MFTIRPYENRDKVAVWNLHNAALRPTGAHAGNGDWDNDLHHIPEVYLETGGVFLVGLLNGGIVAMGALERKGQGQAEVRRMRVHPDQQRNNFGQLILEQLEESALQLGLRNLYLETTTLQETAQRFYMKNNYRETERKIIAPFEVIHYEKTLGTKGEE
ncbi:GNAT family N-acetyltransferase [Pontiella sulfatireligans]|uniref:N-acetyltransferase domain-containing protein n=1 Tax=Pontiella sulfatireligans TaxID=2750658 RepID=A0A6C2USK9_9BACT|nr:GNAT family N-acetyltransferase [Pontiella sulfatireligans]VGO22207.1 hypothetical protein SCARR_04289 [Pontiella sulfatireligans]